jgi:hypothetical protein
MTTIEYLQVPCTYMAGSAILTMLQINEVGYNPVTRTTALLSLVCSFMSLLYGIVYIG